MVLRVHNPLHLVSLKNSIIVMGRRLELNLSNTCKILTFLIGYVYLLDNIIDKLITI